MLGNGEAQNRIIRPEFNRSILMDFLGAKITSDAGFLALREIDERFKEWIIRRLIKVGAKVVYHGRRWQVHVASAFPLFRHYEEVFG